ncbi:hypothetical protein HAU32_06820 [Weissella confusa]|uniref:Uncharacterized protein n=1 Tax=Weissella fermenti TaxID=2987699 RepID=A0ABT6D5A5_9LACO|nr:MULTISPECIES: hypothetical protein [Weissella]MBJ7688685.1 hypothetical protein [Weissella confusa]MCW0928106.1 hypothetical protein [Weissella sp. LMG 11983]MDF9300700.1 hypothetical protein [Weissella sp. BK2]
MNKKNKKMLLVTIASLSMLGATVATQTDPVAASPYLPDQGLETVRNSKQIVINLVDAAGKTVTWTKADGTNGGSSIEYYQDGDVPGLTAIDLPDGLVAQLALSPDQGRIYKVSDGKFYVDASKISSSVGHFTLNVTEGSDAETDDVSSSEPAEPTEPTEPTKPVEPTEPEYVTPEAVVPNEPVVAPAAPHSGALVPDQAPSVSSEATIAPTVSATPQTSSITKPVLTKAVNSVSVEPSVIATVASATSVAPVITKVASATAMPVVTTPIAKTVNAVVQASVPTAVTPDSVAQSASEPEGKTPTQAQAVKSADLISSIGDLPKASVWTDKARTFSAVSIGMSMLAAGAQLLMTKLGFIKSFL